MNYYIATRQQDNMFLCTVYNKNNNFVVYTTQPHPIQNDAVAEANMYIRTSAKPAPQTLAKRSLCCGR